jgi:hypothetical protein
MPMSLLLTPYLDKTYTTYSQMSAAVVSQFKSISYQIQVFFIFLPPTHLNIAED